jgi:hypothetical protein
LRFTTQSGGLYATTKLSQVRKLTQCANPQLAAIARDISKLKVSTIK